LRFVDFQTLVGKPNIAGLSNERRKQARANDDLDGFGVSLSTFVGEVIVGAKIRHSREEIRRGAAVVAREGVGFEAATSPGLTG
jgi:hypothetical protein